MTKTFVLQDAAGGGAHRIDYGKELNQEQLEVVLHGDGPCLVLAGAGSGKTRTITYRVAYLLEENTDPSSILLLTFTNKSARELVERVERLLGAQAGGIWGGTFHSIANRLLRMYADRVGYTSSFTILDSDDSRDLIKGVLKDLHLDPRERRFPSPAVCQSVMSYARNAGVSIREVLEKKHPHFQPVASEVEQLAEGYVKRKRLSNAMDFDDLLENLYRLLEDPEVGPRIAERFRYVLVDEYQDTNALQARIVRKFASAHGNVLVVGDDAQSIYAFRGADVRNILSFPEIFPGARMFKLLTNYRSTPQILEIANETLKQNAGQFQKDLVGIRADGELPSLVPCASVREEAQYVAEQVLQLRDQGTALRNIAVLFRASSQSQRLELELLKRDVPYEYRGGQKFFERAHVKDVLAFLRVHQNPNDEPAWLRVWGLQTGIGATTASQLVTRAQQLGGFRQVLDADLGTMLPSKARQGWEEFHGMGEALDEEAPNPAAMIRALAESRYQELLEREYPNWRERLEDIEQFALFAEGYDDLSRFLADVSLYDDVLARRKDAGEGVDEERIVLSTVHQAKGLEWDTVFILHLAEGAFPNRRAMEEEGGMEEERRLFYVAVTRARRKLFLSYPLTMGMEAWVLNRPSPFLDELHPRLLERIQLVPQRSFHPMPVPRFGAGSSTGGEWSGGDEATIEWDRYGERMRPSSSTPRSSPANTGTVWKKKGVK